MSLVFGKILIHLKMACLNPQKIKSPESRWLDKCRIENRSYEYYIHQANQRRNLQYDPIPLIQTPVDYYLGHTDSRFMYVPCGKCDLCLKQKVDSLFIRSYFEFLDCKYARSGSVYFVTLTFADDILPRFDGTPCFNVDYVQKFLKRLRKISGLTFKYIIVSEFGGEYGRPHHHGLFFIDNYEDTISNQFKFFDFVARSWTKINERNNKWRAMSDYGIFDMQRVDVKPVHDTRLLRYVSKYVGKQFGSLQFDQRKDIPKQNRRFTLKSIGLGQSIYKYCNADVWDKGLIYIENFEYAIPMYYKIKKMREYYCTMENGILVYRPSDFKYQYFANFCREQVQEMKDLSLLNRDFPKVPDEFYDPEVLNTLYTYIDDYVVFRELPIDTKVQYYFDLWNNYLQDVQLFYRDKFRQRAKQWSDSLLKKYMKKTGRS